MSLFIETRGRGPDVVLLHGWAMNGSVWNKVAEALAQDFCVHVVDLPGHGKSPARSKLTLDSIVDELQLAFPWPVQVVGWSLGGAIATQWALRSPEQVRSLTLVASSPCFAQRPDWPHATAPETLNQFAENLMQDWQGTLKRFIGLQVLGDQSARQVARELTHDLLRHGEPDLQALEDALEILRTTDLRARLPELSCPILLQFGDRDALTPVAAAEWLVQALPLARYELHRGAAHVPFVSHLDAFICAQRDFLQMAL